MILPDAPWRHAEGLDRLLDALDVARGATRFVGGAVRDGLLGLPVEDVDCGTLFDPATVRDRVRAAGFKAVPTGLAHGTITAVLPGGPVEITTLRRDVSTDGRRATVAFTDSWQEDAARRDFTINALSADPVSGAVHDYFGGMTDLTTGHVRFIGDPLVRIAEDHLRILRFFRFHARFGRGQPDPTGIEACTARANDLMALSRERIADELLKLLTLPDPVATVRLMIAQGILRPVLPEIADADLLARLVTLERTLGVAPDSLRRLAALLPTDPGRVIQVAGRLRLSRAATRRLAQAAETDAPGNAAALAYRRGVDGAIDQLLLRAAGGSDLPQALASLEGWDRPALPIGGGDLIAMGLDRGPAVAATLQAIERQWIDEGFPGRDRVATIAAEQVAAALGLQPPRLTRQ